MLGIIKKLLGGGSTVDYKLLLSQGAVIVDVRTVGEFRGGHIKGAINIPLDEVKSRTAELKKKNKPVITCCRSGNRSGVAKSLLVSAGVECYNGGAWDTLNHKIV
ncbi:sulfurtransferase [Terrimonas sp.]|uniref:rhodanese-like domain-containing protein n=1 Tax=Terrimonas sp. TaxID=1914338 RepID=UPI000D51B397|nr:rhodanese-like domain-containing protein [Terrimonas sp.]PVD51922.1 sulfurtransferase [Terrimonas sp.]